MGCGMPFCVCVNKIGDSPRNSLPVDLPNSVPKSHHVAARTFRTTAERVLGQFSLERP
jgi:hypothetical protein